MTRTKLNLAALILLAACAKSDEFYLHGYWWKPWPEGKKCTEDETWWLETITTEVVHICGPGKVGCTIQDACSIVSMYDRYMSMKVIIPPADESHYAHEMRHRTQQLTHPQ